MKRILVLSLCLIFFYIGNSETKAQSFENPGKFTSELMFGLRVPSGETRNDVLSGFTLKFGVGYQFTKRWELLNLAFDFGNSTPHDPDWFYNYYSYSLQQEVVNVYGFPVTTRYRFKIQDQLEVYVSAGAAYYWFRTRLNDPYFGELKKARRRHGPGGLLEAGIYTDAFGENLLVGVIGNVLYLRTKGETLTTPRTENAAELNQKVTRDDWYITIGISLRYFLGKK